MKCDLVDYCTEHKKKLLLSERESANYGSSNKSNKIILINMYQPLLPLIPTVALFSSFKICYILTNY